MIFARRYYFQCATPAVPAGIEDLQAKGYEGSRLQASGICKRQTAGKGSMRAAECRWGECASRRLQGRGISKQQTADKGYESSRGDEGTDCRRGEYENRRLQAGGIWKQQTAGKQNMRAEHCRQGEYLRVWDAQRRACILTLLDRAH